MENLNFKIAKAIEVGRMHEYMDLPCQDAISCCKNDDIVVGVLADGAGSVEDSDYISKIVVETISKYLFENFESLYNLDEQEIASTLLHLVDRAFLDTDYKADCTLLFFAMMKDGRNIMGHIGDGIIIGIDKDKLLLSKPENGTNINETFFLSGPNTLNHFRITKNVIKDIDTILLSSDGISHLLYSPKDDNFARAIDIIRQWIIDYDEETVSCKLQSELINLFKKEVSDDMSILLINWHTY